LVATDFSRYADRILECIGEIPGMEEILLVHVLTRPDDQARLRLEEMGHYLQQTTGVPVKPLLVEAADGDPVRGIVTTANNSNSSLIVLGAQGKSFIGELFLGSVSKEVIRRAGIDILVMRFRGLGEGEGAPFEKFCKNVFSHVLCPIDFSKPSQKTLEYLKSLQVIRWTTLLHVLPEKDQDSSRIDEATRELERVRVDLESRGIRTDSLLRFGDPVTEICRVAEERDVSLILIARFGRSDYVSNIPLGRVVAGVAVKAQRPLFVLSPHISLTVHTRELKEDEFGLAEHLWLTYHQQKADPATDRIFGVFVEGLLVAVARCRRHPDGLEVDGVYVPVDYRDRGYARKAVQALVDACGSEPLYMHSTLTLIPFYQSFGFEIIPESTLPPSIRKRFEFAGGNLAGANVAPMRRQPGKNH
jgi:nucleotide-binding universal stress UspA family protein/predicted GNAT family N-acyltransferase